MTPADLERLLAQTLEDRRLSKPERQALRDALTRVPPPPATLAAGRRAAVTLAAAAVTDPAARDVLTWLADVLPLLDAPAAAGPSADASFSPRHDCAGRIGTLVGAARTAIDACVFTVTDDRIADALIAARRRGVAVRVLSDNEKAVDLGSDMDRLRAAGVTVRLDRSPFHMHHKFALFDGRTLLNGSYNWTRGAARDNKENFVVTDDPRLVTAFAQEFERLWAEMG